jgi:sec-independent protein translocase protein TatA
MGPPELIIIAVIALAVIFGAKKLPEIARNLGRSSGEFKQGLKDGAELEQPKPAPEPAPKPSDPTSEV